jgi:hypothetical protein
MSDNEELHLVFGTGPVGLSVMDALIQGGRGGSGWSTVAVGQECPRAWWW